jgi:hypothetical protein
MKWKLKTTKDQCFINYEKLLKKYQKELVKNHTLEQVNKYLIDEMWDKMTELQKNTVINKAKAPVENSLKDIKLIV